ncbi:MAG: hypothetical protein JW801_09755 [Bacteroidales bacterium]|nr:hypothetical protein [Bacteroidales bacterium]
MNLFLFSLLIISCTRETEIGECSGEGCINLSELKTKTDYPVNSRLQLESVLVQRAMTGGQLNYSTTTIKNSIFTDFPDDGSVYQDTDNDALYIDQSTVSNDSLKFMFTKNDGLDSGGGKGGTVSVTNSLFEACFHEGAALSGSNDVEKIYTFAHCKFKNCGQGLELGYSSPNHTEWVTDCRFENNGIGIRYGDNYDYSSVEGQLFVDTTYRLYNVREVWNMIRNNCTPRTENMHLENVVVSVADPNYPELVVLKL